MKGRFYPCAGRIHGTGCNFGNRIIGTDAAYLETAMANNMRTHTDRPGGKAPLLYTERAKKSAVMVLYRIAQRTEAVQAAAVAKKYFFRQAAHLQ